jgi:hypothetical protein
MRLKIVSVDMDGFCGRDFHPDPAMVGDVVTVRRSFLERLDDDDDGANAESAIRVYETERGDGSRVDLIEHEIEFVDYPLWLREFGPDFFVPLELELAGLVDLSWHNDVCPSFCLPEAADTENPIRLWIDHPVAALRERGADAPRFLVTDGGGGLDIYEGEDFAAALAALRTAAPASPSVTQ